MSAELMLLEGGATERSAAPEGLREQLECYEGEGVSFFPQEGSINEYVDDLSINEGGSPEQFSKDYTPTNTYLNAQVACTRGTARVTLVSKQGNTWVPVGPEWEYTGLNAAKWCIAREKGKTYALRFRSVTGALHVHLYSGPTEEPTFGPWIQRAPLYAAS